MQNSQLTRTNPIKTVIKSTFLSIIQWFDCWAGDDEALTKEPQKIDWIRAIPFFGMHLMCLGVIWVGFSWVALAVAVAFYLVRMFFVTGFYHRYFSHRTFKTSRWFQSVMALCGLSAAQKGPLWWAAHHRDHHKHSDTEVDVHSPHEHGFFWSHIGWVTSKPNFPTKLHVVKDLAKYPELCLMDRFSVFVPIASGFFMFGLGWGLDKFLPALGTSGMQMLIWGFFISTVAVFHGTCTINSLCHIWGRKRYKSQDESRNSLLLALITLGEGWHNNHHYYPGTARQGFYWWEIDITYYVLKMMSWVGLIWDVRKLPKEKRDDYTAMIQPPKAPIS